MVRLRNQREAQLSTWYDPSLIGHVKLSPAWASLILQTKSMQCDIRLRSGEKTCTCGKSSNYQGHHLVDQLPSKSTNKKGVMLEWVSMHSQTLHLGRKFRGRKASQCSGFCFNISCRSPYLKIWYPYYFVYFNIFLLTLFILHSCMHHKSNLLTRVLFIKVKLMSFFVVRLQSMVSITV